MISENDQATNSTNPDFIDPDEIPVLNREDIIDEMLDTLGEQIERQMSYNRKNVSEILNMPYSSLTRILEDFNKIITTYKLTRKYNGKILYGERAIIFLRDIRLLKENFRLSNLEIIDIISEAAITVPGTPQENVQNTLDKFQELLKNNSNEMATQIIDYLKGQLPGMLNDPVQLEDKTILQEQLDQQKERLKEKDARIEEQSSQIKLLSSIIEADRSSLADMKNKLAEKERELKELNEQDTSDSVSLINQQTEAQNKIAQLEKELEEEKNKSTKKGFFARLFG